MQVGLDRVPEMMAIVFHINADDVWGREKVDMRLDGQIVYTGVTDDYGGLVASILVNKFGKKQLHIMNEQGRVAIDGTLEFVKR